MKELVEVIAKALVDKPEDGSGERCRRRASYRAGVEGASHRFGKSDWPAGTHGEVYPHNSGRGWNENEEAPDARNS